MNVDLFQWCANVHFPSQPHAQAPQLALQARAAFFDLGFIPGHSFQRRGGALAL